MEFEFDDYTCNQFFFDNYNDDELLFFTATEITRFKYKEDYDNQEETIYTLNNFLVDPPNFGVFNKDQDKCIVTSVNDILFVDLRSKFEMDIDDRENISEILNILADDTHFYILANKKNEIVGYYLLMIEINDPEKEAIYLINWQNQLNIRQVDLNFLRDKNDKDEM